MTEIIEAVVASLEAPDPAVLAAALQASAEQAKHHRFAAAIPALAVLEYRAPPVSSPQDRRLRLVAWNVERLKYGAASAALLQPLAPDLVLLSETDIGMARSGNRHTTADLAAALGMGHAYGVEFVELSLGDEREHAWHKGQRNAVGFHGNAILSRLPLTDLAMIRLDDGGRWFGAEAGEQRRLGGRMALAARLKTASGSLVAVSLHLESVSSATDRAAQISRLLAALDGRYGRVPMVIGGDCNTAALPAGVESAAWIDRVAVLEPLFAVMAQAGFDWHDANDMAPTQRQRPDGRPLPPFHRIDWIFTRGIGASAPRTVAAVDAQGSAISDHDALVVALATD